MDARGPRGRARDANGATVWRELVRPGGPVAEVRVGLRAGRYRFHAFSDRGLTGRAELVVPEPGTDLPPVELHLSLEVAPAEE